MGFSLPFAAHKCEVQLRLLTIHLPDTRGLPKKWRMGGVKFQNVTDRELSWLAFDQRVLELAEDERIPLLERVRFLAIFSSNLDEFFMVRVATLMSKIENDVTAPNVAGIAPKKLMSQISSITRALIERQSTERSNDKSHRGTR